MRTRYKVDVVGSPWDPAVSAIATTLRFEAQRDEIQSDTELADLSRLISTRTGDFSRVWGVRITRDEQEALIAGQDSNGFTSTVLRGRQTILQDFVEDHETVFESCMVER